MTLPFQKFIWPLFGAFSFLTVAIYWPALYGGYIFDDAIYFVQNSNVHVTTLSAGDWWRAATSQCNVNLLCRPLSSLTFAANYFFSGIDPFWPKLTNVCIHLVNGLLLFLTIRELLRLRAEIRKDSSYDLAAVLIAGAWLVLPINLTGVVYLSQRMESLANLFVLAGLYSYLRLRRQHYFGRSNATTLWISLITFTGAGLLAKEDAALLPLYTACIEFSLLQFKNSDGRRAYEMYSIYTCLLLVPLIAGLIYIYPQVVSGVSSYREFTAIERLLTEARILVHYIQWTLIPNLNSLTFYHDDISLSHSILRPPTTLAALAFLVTLLGTALWQRKARPLLCLGILWFFAGHSMTATIIPLELVFEHRNYFPSIGLLLACTSLIEVEPVAQLGPLKPFIVVAFLAFFSFTTLLRAEEWSHPLRLAYTEAQKRPNSERAQYELARTLIVASSSQNEPQLIDEAKRILAANAFKEDSGVTSLQALIFIAAREHQPIDPKWWEAITKKLRTHAPSQSDVAAIIFLYRCQIDGTCPTQTQELLDAFVAGLERSDGNPNLMSAYGEFALRQLGDARLAENMYRGAVAARPQLPLYRTNLIEFLIATGQFEKSEQELGQLENLNRFGALDNSVDMLRIRLASAKRSVEAEATDAEKK